MFTDSLSYSFCYGACPVAFKFLVTIFFSPKIFIWFFFVSSVSCLSFFFVCFCFLSFPLFQKCSPLLPGVLFKIITTLKSYFIPGLCPLGTGITWFVLSHVSWGVSWFSACGITLDWSWISGCYTVRRWVLFKPCGERCCPCCHWHSTTWRSDSRCLPAFCGFRYQLCFQSLSGTLQVCPCVSPPGQHGTLAVFFPGVEYSASGMGCWALCPCVLSTRGSLGPHIQLGGAEFLPLHRLPCPCQTQGPLLLGFSARKQGCYFSRSAALSLRLSSYLWLSKRVTKREKIQRVFTRFKPQLLQLERKVCSLKVLGICGPLCCCCQGNCWGLGVRASGRQRHE